MLGINFFGRQCKSFVFIALAAFVLGVAFASVALGQAQQLQPIPLNTTISIQGILRGPEKNLLSGSYNMKFEIYDSQTGGTKFWSEEQIVSISNGRYQVYLGKISPLMSNLAIDKPLFVQIYVKSPAEISYQPLINRFQLSQILGKIYIAKIAESANFSQTAASLSGNIDISKVTGLITSDRISGVLDVEKIPSLDAGKIATGIFDAARIPSLDAGKIATGIFDATRIPSLDAGKITTGVFSVNQIPSISDSKITDVGAGKISGNVDSKLSYKVSGGVSSVSDGATINFNTKSYGVSSFINAPNVVCSSEDGYICATTGISTTGFTVKLIDYNSNRPASPKSVNWQATGS